MSAFYGFAILVASWPVPMQFASRVLGDERSGAWRTLWAHWWTRSRLARDGAWPLDAPEIAYPRGGSFSSIAPINDLLSLPVQSIGLVEAYNFVVYFHWLLACVGAYVLARVVGLRPSAALVCGVVFGFNGFLLSYGLGSAVVETNTQGWIPLFLASMIWLIRSPSPIKGALCGLLFAICGLCSLYWALIAGLLAPVIAVPYLVDRARSGKPLRPALVASAFAIVVAIVVFAPLGGALMGTYGGTDALLQDYSIRKQSFIRPEIMQSLAHDFATVAGYLLPGDGELAVHADMDRLMQTTYLGWIALLLAVFGVVRGRFRWAAVGVAGLILSLGPFAFVTADAWREDPVWWWVSLRALVPPTKMVTSYVRFSVFAFLGMGILAGSAIQRLPRWHGVAGTLVAVGIVVEAFLFSPAVLPIPSAHAQVPRVSLELAVLPEVGAVLDWPQRYPGESVEVSRYFYYQSVHGRPIPYDFAPTSYMPGPIESNPFFLELERVSFGEDYVTTAPDALEDVSIHRGLADLEDMGFAYLVVHSSFVAEDRRELLVGWLDATLTRVAAWDGDFVYIIESST